MFSDSGSSEDRNVLPKTICVAKCFGKPGCCLIFLGLSPFGPPLLSIWGRDFPHPPRKCRRFMNVLVFCCLCKGWNAHRRKIHQSCLPEKCRIRDRYTPIVIDTLRLSRKCSNPGASKNKHVHDSPALAGLMWTMLTGNSKTKLETV